MFRWKPEHDRGSPCGPPAAGPWRRCRREDGARRGRRRRSVVPRAGPPRRADHRRRPARGDAGRRPGERPGGGVAARAVCGTWPDVAGEVEPSDVAVCHHAIYGEVEIEPFLAALTASARHRVVIEVGAHPPLIGLNPPLKGRPRRRAGRPLRGRRGRGRAHSMGLAVEREDIVLAPSANDVTPERVAFVRRRLCVGPERDAEIAAFLEEQEPTAMQVAALWWPGAADRAVGPQRPVDPLVGPAGHGRSDRHDRRASSSDPREPLAAQRPSEGHGRRTDTTCSGAPSRIVRRGRRPSGRRAEPCTGDRSRPRAPQDRAAGPGERDAPLRHPAAETGPAARHHPSAGRLLCVRQRCRRAAPDPLAPPDRRIVGPRPQP